MDHVPSRKQSFATGFASPSPVNASGSVSSSGGLPPKLHRQNSLNNAAVNAALEDKHVSTRRQSIAVLNGEISLKVSKQSSAHRKLHSKKHRDELLSRLADIIKHTNDEDHKQSTKGKLPIEAAYTVMKRITEAAKVPILPVGMSTFNKLESLRTDPALKVLQSTTWRDFFSVPSAASHNAPSTTASAAHGASGMASTQPQDSATETAENDDPMLDVLFDSLIERVETLWTQLKMPLREQQFFRKSLCQRPIASMEQCKELASYVERLEEHKTLTKAVLRQIACRESTIRKCYDVLTALHRKFSQNNNSNIYNSNNTLGFQTTKTFASTQNMNSSSAINASVFWKEELLLSLDEVRCASLETIKAIQLWRRAMWRPHAFVYREVNYLLKMKEDMSLLESDVMHRVLESVPLSADTLQCIVFIPIEAYNASARSPFRSTATRSMSQKSLSLASLHEEDEEQQPMGAALSGEAYIENLTREFVNNIDREELRAAAAVVFEEERLQQALATEHAALRAKGVFIPLLRPAANLAMQQQQTHNTQQFSRTGSSSKLHIAFQEEAGRETSSSNKARPQSASGSGRRSKIDGSLSPDQERQARGNFMPFSTADR